MEKSIEQVLKEGEQQIVARVLGRDVTRGELSAAFAKVEPKNHWKNPIDAQVEIGSDREMEMIREAVVFFTGSRASFELVRITQRIAGHQPGAAIYRVRAAGYFAAVGA